MSVTIEIIGPDFDGYAVKVDGDIIMECLSESEARGLRIGEIIDTMRSYERDGLLVITKTEAILYHTI